MKTKNKIYIVENSIAPKKAHSDDAAIDLFIQNDTTIPPHSTAYLRAGAKLDLMPGFAGVVFSRSSTPMKGLGLFTTMIDPGYKGEFSSVITNYTDDPITVYKGERFGQLMLIPYFQFENEEEQDILENNKGERSSDAKFGSSGTSVIL
jgi:dUTP pyrophosphatase